MEIDFDAIGTIRKQKAFSQGYGSVLQMNN